MIRKEISKLDNSIGSVICKENGDLQICYYKNKTDIESKVCRYLGKKSLLECFVKIKFIQTPQFI